MWVLANSLRLLDLSANRLASLPNHIKLLRSTTYFVMTKNEMVLSTFHPQQPEILLPQPKPSFVSFRTDWWVLDIREMVTGWKIQEMLSDLRSFLLHIISSITSRNLLRVLLLSGFVQSFNEVASCLPSQVSLMIRECKLAANRLTEFPLELTNLPNLQLLDLSLNQVDPD